MEPEEYEDRRHNDGDGDDEESYAVGVCEILVKTAGTTISVSAPDTEAARELAAIAMGMASQMQKTMQ